MSYLERHKQACIKLAADIDDFIVARSLAETRFCKDAGAHVAALKKLRKGAATPATYDLLEKHLAILKRVDSKQSEMKEQDEFGT